MKKSLPISVIVFLTSVLNLFSQPYYKVLQEDRYWIYTKMGLHDPPIYIFQAFALTPQGDTVLQGLTYKKIYQLTLKKNATSTDIQYPKQVINKNLYALMREDTIERKVYLLSFYDTKSMCQPAEHLLYDFSLQEGDTLNECVLENIYLPFMSDISRVDSIRQFVYSGLETRAFYMRGVFDNYGNSFEDTGLILEGYGYERHGLINYGRNGFLVLFQYFCEGDSLDCELLSAVEDPEVNPVAHIVISPNPTHDILRIQKGADFQNEAQLKVSILDIAGNVINYTDWNTFQALEIDVRDLPVGMYILNLNGERTSTTTKIVKAR